MGRKALVLTTKDVIELVNHIKALPFKRKVEQRLLGILPGKKTINDFSEPELLLITKCRYEKNAYLKQMAALAKIQSCQTPTKFERDILDLANRTDIDAHFLKLDALKNYLQQEDQKKAEIKLRNEKKRLEAKLNKSDPSLKKQRDRENYYLGAMCKKLFELTGFHTNQSNDLKRLEQLFIDGAVMSSLIERNNLTLSQKKMILEQHNASEKIKNTTKDFEANTRNPFK